MQNKKPQTLRATHTTRNTASLYSPTNGQRATYNALGQRTSGNLFATPQEVHNATNPYKRMK